MKIHPECLALAICNAEESDAGLGKAARGRKTEMGLTSRQEAFARAVVQGRNQADAYRSAYPASLKWKPQHVWTEASELMAKPKVFRRVAELQRLAADYAVINATVILEEARRIALSDIRRLMHDDGRVKIPSELDAATAAAVESFQIDEYGRVRYKLWDKNAALDKLFRYFGLYRSDHVKKPEPFDGRRVRIHCEVLGVAQECDPIPDDDWK
jgi:hypothetical protein